MDIFGERTLCLLSPAISSITASTFLPGSTSRGSRSRTRMGTSMERYFYTFILYSLALVILLSPSASANQRCTPTFSILYNGYGTGSEEYGNISPSDGELKTHVTIREKASYKLTCMLNRFHSIKWTINGREVTSQMENEMNIEITSGEEMDGYLYTELMVNNASQKQHAGEYKCTNQCMTDAAVIGANVGVVVTINIAINVTIEDSASGPDSMGVKVYRKFVERERAIELICKAPVPNAQMTWFRIKDDKTEENMVDVCIGPDVELLAKEIKKPPPHCTVKVGSKDDDATTTLNLRINRARKGNEKLKTISDFRRYICKAEKEGNQDGQAMVEIYERVSVDRKFDKGMRSVSVIEGNQLKIYCDVHGIEKAEFDHGHTKLQWTKDEQQLQIDELKGIQKIGEYNEDTGRGRPYRVGFTYEMAEPEHRGKYRCLVVRSHAPEQETHRNGTATQVSYEYYVRVKDKLGALWPFLGICGEVVILCTIILIYEKRRNKQELDESDTDGSPDQ